MKVLQVLTYRPQSQWLVLNIHCDQWSWLRDEADAVEADAVEADAAEADAAQETDAMAEEVWNPAEWHTSSWDTLTCLVFPSFVQ